MNCKVKMTKEEWKSLAIIVKYAQEYNELSLESEIKIFLILYNNKEWISTRNDNGNKQLTWLDSEVEFSGVKELISTSRGTTLTFNFGRTKL